MTLHGKAAFRGPVSQPARRCGIALRRRPSGALCGPAAPGAQAARQAGATGCGHSGRPAGQSPSGTAAGPSSAPWKTALTSAFTIRPISAASSGVKVSGRRMSISPASTRSVRGSGAGLA